MTDDDVMQEADRLTAEFGDDATKEAALMCGASVSAGDAAGSDFHARVYMLLRERRPDIDPLPFG